MTSDGTVILESITPLLLCNTINSALLKALLAEVRFTTIHHIQLIAVANSTPKHLLKCYSA